MVCGIREEASRSPMASKETRLQFYEKKPPLNKNKQVISVCMLTLLIGMLSTSANAWWALIHDAMTRATIEGLPPDVRRNINVEAFLYGANEPDGTMYDPTKAQVSRDYAFDRIDQNWAAAEIKTGISQTELRNWRSKSGYHGSTDSIEALRSELVGELAAPIKNWNKISVLMGQLSHHVQDLHQPYHAAEVKGLPVSPGDHERFEQETGQIFKARGIRLEPLGGGSTNTNLDSIAKEAASRVSTNKDLGLYNNSLKQHLQVAVSNNIAILNAAVDQAQPEVNLENARERIQRSKSEQEREKNKEEQENFDGQWGPQPTPPDPSPLTPQGGTETPNCPFKWTHPLCNWTYCCPYNNGWDKDCYRAGNCWPAVEGCMKGFGCRRVD
jgi:hypothetical protein